MASNTTPPTKKSTRIGFAGKTLWDWLATLLIPLAVAGATLVFSIQQAHLADLQHQSDQQRALDQQQATILQTYIDNIQDLLLNHNLLKSKPTEDAAILARARTLTALKALDPERRGRLLIFLYEAQLIGFCEGCKTDSPMPIQHDAIIDLSGAYLVEAMLGDTDLIRANLSNTNLYGAALYRADLRYANLTGADLRQANLDYADLRYATITQQQLHGVYSCKTPKLPPGLTCP